MPENEILNKKIKLLAIRPLEKCNNIIKRILAEGEIYQFYNDYTFNYTQQENKLSDIVSISHKPTTPEDLYYIEQNSSNKSLPIYISAIVGKNGSGKSSIVELFYAACYNIAHNLKLLPNEDDYGNELVLINDLNVELYYIIDDNYYKLQLKDNYISILIQSSKLDKFIPLDVNLKRNHLENFFFYTISINYSHHALNSRNLGLWVNQIFHKNDGYQTPIVLNPYRKDGNIQINNEEYLTKSRLLSIILTKLGKNSIKQREDSTNDNYYREITPGKTAIEITISLNKKKIAFEKGEESIQEELNNNKGHILDDVLMTFGITRSPEPYNTKNNFLRIAYAYILKKTWTISNKYTLYQNKKFNFLKKNKLNEHKYTFDHTSFKAFIKELKNDNSHITFKLRQAITFIKNYEKYSTFLGYKKKNNLNDLADFLYDIKGEDALINVLPPSFFNFEIYFKEGGSFRNLSSGEKQKIFSSASYIYHIVNLHSVKTSRHLVKYPYINIIFDEIELYYHPELQRTFIRDFINNISRLETPYISGINCLFITHSPFILSDIPNANVLFLEKNATPVDHKKALDIDTFGANVYDLLKHSFFLEKGAMGAFAKEKISNTIDFLNLELLRSRLSELEKQPSKEDHIKDEIIKVKSEINELEEKDFNTNIGYHEQIIDMIGEPVLKKKLQSMFYQVRNTDELLIIDNQIKELEKKRSKLTANK